MALTQAKASRNVSPADPWRDRKPRRKRKPKQMRKLCKPRPDDGNYRKRKRTKDYANRPWPRATEREQAKLDALTLRAYEHSSHWKLLIEALQRATQGKCEKCHKPKRREVHQITIETRGAETRGELRLVCAQCHMDAHAERWRDSHAVK